LPAVWIAQDQRDAAIAAGYTVVDPTTALSTHLSEVIRTFLPDLLTRQQTKDLIDQVGQSSPKLVEELVPKVASVGDVQRVLRQLLRERVPVRDLTTILEAMADAAAVSKDPDVIVEAVRSALGRSICRTYQDEKGELRVISLSAGLEDALAASMTRTERGALLAMDPARAQSLAERLAQILASEDLAQPVLLCSPMLRPHLWRLFSRALPHVAVLSHAEVPAQVRIVSVGSLD
jgi:flagellar biosynthesis protein FlhA